MSTNTHSHAAQATDDLGARLSALLQQLGISQTEFARMLGSSPSFISDLVRGIKKPGTDFLLSIREHAPVNLHWLLTGEGGMLGGEPIDIRLLRLIRLQIALARAVVIGQDATAKALTLLIREGRLDEVSTDPLLKRFLDALVLDTQDFDLAIALYNGHVATYDHTMRMRNILSAALTHFEAQQPLDHLGALTPPKRPVSFQINIGQNQRNAGKNMR